MTRHDQIPAYDAVFRRYFLGDRGRRPDGPTPFDPKAREEAESMLRGA